MPVLPVKRPPPRGVSTSRWWLTVNSYHCIVSCSSPRTKSTPLATPLPAPVRAGSGVRARVVYPGMHSTKHAHHTGGHTGHTTLPPTHGSPLSWSWSWFLSRFWLGLALFWPGLALFWPGLDHCWDLSGPLLGPMPAWVWAHAGMGVGPCRHGSASHAGMGPRAGI